MSPAGANLWPSLDPDLESELEDNTFGGEMETVPWGPVYGESNSRYIGDKKNPFFYDEVEDFLALGVYPRRLR